MDAKMTPTQNLDGTYSVGYVIRDESDAFLAASNFRADSLVELVNAVIAAHISAVRALHRAKKRNKEI